VEPFIDITNGVGRYEDINPRHVKVNTSKDYFEYELDEFEVGQDIYPKAGDSLVDILTKKKEKD